ncbi:prepilin-type N-terminal cleavage/methylation domain-containing protein [Bythopirellula goksoeyrii]|uniref:Prepilin-type N-terminal cleavage/methylation domain-containing protein n=1 Tax=Bythopirellula goksoeyrii TaxID=1400387 RepID=A0A5B9QCJ6_9BACT|nr:prepilin-type N-terminal cleavage/methylation domain-containing protein [Bythopirellula goksoeyrii]QEG34666.1 hypothetical protein Pr1d_19480 [Bythopirellula goksoeyrii]
MRHHNGFTLIEVMVSISVSSVLMVLSLGMVHRVMNLESSSRDQARVSRSMTRLGHDFRSDVQRSSAVETDHEAVLELTFADGAVVTYRVLDEHVLREQAVDDSRTRREYYNLPADADVEFTEHVSPTRWEISVTRDLKLVGIAPRPLLQTMAEVGRLLRLAGLQEVKQ